MTKIDWENITNYIESVGSTDTVFPFAKAQSSVKVTNGGGSNNLIYTIGGQSGTLTPGQNVTVTGSITSMTLRASAGRQAFQVWAVEAGTEKDEPETDFASQLAQNTSYITNGTINVKIPFHGLTAAKGDGVTDDYTALQAIFDYAYDNGYKVYLPKGDYLVSKPLMIYGNSDQYGKYNVIIEGAGRDVTNIIKNTNTTLGSGEYGSIDSIFIVGNEYIKNNQAITNIWSNQSIAFKVMISNLTLKSTASTAVANGIYSYGIYMSKFYNLGFQNMGTAFKTTRYNCYNTFERLEINLTSIGFDIWSDSSGATTLRFMDVHLNGLTQYGYKLKGHGTFINCSNDGGTLTVYYFLSSRVSLINCHSESPACNQVLYADGNTSWGPSTITMLNCGIMTPLSSTNPTFQLVSYSKVHVVDLKMNTNVVSGLPTTPQGKLYTAGKDCRIMFEHFRFIGTEYATPVNVPVSDGEKFLIVDKNHLSPTNHTYIPYVSGGVASANYTVATVTPDNTNKVLTFAVTGTDGNGQQALFFDNAIKFDGYSRLYMKGTIDFVTGSASECSVRVQSSVQTGTHVGTPVTYVSKDSRTTDATDYEWYVDITDLYGNYYVEIFLATTGTLTIKEVSLLK